MVDFTCASDSNLIFLFRIIFISILLFDFEFTYCFHCSAFLIWFPLLVSIHLGGALKMLDLKMQDWEMTNLG